MDTQNKMAERVKSLKASAIREIFKIVGQPGMISMAGGIPSPSVFPTEAFAKISEDILSNNGASALVYGVTEGYKPLIKKVEAINKNKNIGRDFDTTIITTGAQQAIDLACKAYVNEGEGIIVEDPSFIGSLNSFRSYNAKLYGAPVLSDGIDTDKVEELLKTENIKLIYVIPTFQNPTGITMSLDKRKKLLELAEKYDCYILEDNPYGDLRFTGEDIPTIKSMDETGRVIYVGSFSKTLAPGLRVGFAVAHADVMDRIVVVKQVNDVHTTLLTQMMVDRFLEKYDFDEQIKKGCDLYKSQCECMLNAMDKYFPEGVTYTRPEGGIFLWVTLPEGVNTNDLLLKCVEKKVAFVPGNSFMIDIEKPTNTFRLNYSTMSNENIEIGIQRIAEILKEYI